MYIKSIITENGSTLNGPVIIEPRVFRDERGSFLKVGIKTSLIIKCRKM